MSQITKAMIQAGCEAQHRYRNEANEGEVRVILEAALAGSSIQLFPSKEEIRRLAELALAEMQEKATTDREAWIASYEKVIMSYHRLALAKQQLADSAPPPLPHVVAGEPAIIRLPWHKEPHGDFWRAEVIGHVYEVHDDEMADYKKRQCQYDFEARVRSALVPQATAASEGE